MTDQGRFSGEELRRRKQMIYRANHRGIKEMDIVIGEYANAHVMQMDDETLDAFEAIMDESDRDLFSWFTGEINVPQKFDTPLFAQILAFTQNKFR